MFLNISVKEDTLEDMVNHLNDDVGLVHQMPFVCDREGFPATLEKVNNSDEAPPALHWLLNAIEPDT